MRELVSGADGARMFAELVDSSLAAAQDASGDVRYRLLAVVRMLAARGLAESGREDEARHAHASWVTTLTRHSATDWAGADRRWRGRNKPGRERYIAHLTPPSPRGAYGCDRVRRCSYDGCQYAPRVRRRIPIASTARAAAPVAATRRSNRPL